MLDKVREAKLRSLLDVVRVSRPVDSLRPLADLAMRQESLAVATLNYDRTIESMSGEAGVPCVRGIEEWQTTGRMKFAERGISLMKLHGSIDWAIEAEHEPLPFQRVTERDPSASGSYRPAIVFGEGGKLRAEGLFLELLLAFYNALNESNRLLIVGYSFRDPHVNELIARWFADDESRLIVLVEPADLSQVRNPFVARLRRIDVRRPSEPSHPKRFAQVQAGAAAGLARAVEIGAGDEPLPQDTA